MPAVIGPASRTALVAVVALALFGVTGCGADGPIGGPDQTKTFVEQIGMYSPDGTSVYVVFPTCLKRELNGVLSGSPMFTVRDDRGSVLWQVKELHAPEAFSLPPATGPMDYFTDSSPTLKVGAAPKYYRTDVAWQPRPVGTTVKFEGTDNLTLYSGSYRYGDRDSPGTIRVNGQSTRNTLDKKCVSSGVPPS